MSNVDFLSVPASPDQGNLVWLASYPKSGNTWTRAFLTSYCLPPSDLALTKRLGWISLISSRQQFDRHMGIASADLQGDELLELRRLYHNDRSSSVPSVSYFKVHDAFLRCPSGQPLFGPQSTRLAVYILRNPLDVVVSYANHAVCSIEDSIATINGFTGNPHAVRANCCAAPFSDRWLSWSENVASWSEQEEVPAHLMRYEDMLADPCRAFAGLVGAIGLDLNEARLQAAVEACGFEKLQSAERDHGFGEKVAGCKTFFKTGKAERWREILTSDQVERVIRPNRPFMERFGYLS